MTREETKKALMAFKKESLVQYMLSRCLVDADIVDRIKALESQRAERALLDEWDALNDELKDLSYDLPGPANLRRRMRRQEIWSRIDWINGRLDVLQGTGIISKKRSKK